MVGLVELIGERNLNTLSQWTWKQRCRIRLIRQMEFRQVVAYLNQFLPYSFSTNIDIIKLIVNFQGQQDHDTDVPHKNMTTSVPGH